MIWKIVVVLFCISGILLLGRMAYYAIFPKKDAPAETKPEP